MGVHKGRGLRGEFGLFSVNFSIFGFRVRWISLFFLASEIGLMSTTPKNTKMDQPMKILMIAVTRYVLVTCANGGVGRDGNKTGVLVFSSTHLISSFNETSFNFNKTGLKFFLKFGMGLSIVLSNPQYIYIYN